MLPFALSTAVDGQEYLAKKYQLKNLRLSGNTVGECY
jgi:hypothetical protein